MQLHPLASLIYLIGYCSLFVAGQTWQQKADVMFVLDSSDTVGQAKYETLKAFVSDLVQQWNIGPDAVQVSVVSYGQGVNNEFDLDAHQDVQTLKQQIMTIPFRGGNSDPANAFKFASETGFSSQHGARSGVPHVIIHVTDQPPTDPVAAASQAQHAFDKGIVIYNVGVGEGTTPGDLNKMTSEPWSRYLLKADTYSSLKSLIPTLGSRINNEVPVSSQTLPPPSSCLQKADLVFIVDSSSSVGQNDFQHLEDFLKDFVQELPVGADQVRVAVVQFANHPSLEFALDIYSDRLSMMKAVENLNFMGGGTNTGDAITYAAKSVFSDTVGARYNVPHIAVVITDGRSTHPTDTTIAADQARLQGISLLSVGVGENVDLKELEDIADDPDAGHVFRSNSYKDLKALSKQILDAACNITTVATAPPTLPPGMTTPDPCQDKADDCAYYDKDACVSYEAWARTNCNKYCGFCQVSDPHVQCEDTTECAPYGTYVCTSPDYAGWARTHCARFCGFCDTQSESLGYYGKCFYKGVEYGHSEKWLDGCDYECVCEDGATGKYRCYNRCPVYSDLPPDCTLIAVPNECCLQPVCDFKQEITTTQGSGKGISPDGLDMCEYGGLQYYDGQSWEIGCDLKCTCTNAATGTYICQAYCPTYTNVPDYCRLVKKPGQCCAAPVCEFETLTGIFEGYGTISGNGMASTGPDRNCVDVLTDCKSYGKSACREYPEWAGLNCARFCDICVATTPAPDASDKCLYDGKSYQQGDTWNIGCDLECTCEVPAFGYYRCDNKCPSYSDIPTGCQTQRKIGECCPDVTCYSGTFNPSATNISSVGNGGGLTLMENGNPISIMPTAPSNTSNTPVNFGRGNRLDGCLFQGRVYVQGQQWEIGCDLNCLCTNASEGLYECRERCPKYENVPASCVMKPNPSDPCCSYPTDCGSNTPYTAIPVYPPTVTNIGAVMSPSISDLISGHFTTKFTVTFAGITVMPPTTPGTKKVDGYCLYKGVQYDHGQTWEDGCDYNCVCEDASTGSYRCVEKCEHYVDLPAQYCHLETDPYNPCCQRPVCNFTASHDEIKGQRNETLAPPGGSTPIPTQTTQMPITPSASPTTQMPITPSASPTTQMPITPSASPTTQMPITPSVSPSQPTTPTPTPASPSSTTSATNKPSSVSPTPSPTPSVTTQNPPTETPPSPTPSPTTGKPTPSPTPSVTTQKPQTETPPSPTPSPTTSKPTPSPTPSVSTQKPQTETPPSPTPSPTTSKPTPSPTPSVSTQKPQTETPPPPTPSPTTNKPTTAEPSTKPTTVSPKPSVTTSMPPPGKEFCVYNGNYYTEGQTWYDGCDYKCTCYDAPNNVYTCLSRCPQYEGDFSTCAQVPDPEDPVCCSVPKCNGTALPPGQFTGTGTVPNRDKCMYKGVEYPAGAVWEDGCKLQCECLDSTIGLFECVDKCQKYADLPPQCSLVQDFANRCCMVPQCSPVAAPTPAPSSGGTTLEPPKTVYCQYYQATYYPGQTWADGCERNCRCEDNGLYTCQERCPTYANLPPTCQLVTDDQDPCCKKPECSTDPQGGATPSPGQIPTLPPKTINGSAYVPNPGQTPNLNACVYNGQQYMQSEKWYDGCDYECVCEDATTGQYTCTERCVQYPKIPPQCQLVKDASNPCCEIPVCDPNYSTPGPNAKTTVTPATVTPPSDVCIYNGKTYTQGQTWYDGCQFSCVCEDATQGIYRCSDRCPAMPNLPQGCYLVPDPRDPLCCESPQCDLLTPPSPDNKGNLVPTLAPAVITGRQVTPSPLPVNAPEKDACIYGGKFYREGQRWTDGCDYNCVCEDGKTGRYTCTEICPQYASLPPQCVYVSDPNNPCCKQPYCDPSFSTPATLSPQSTLVPGVKTAACVYNGAAYSQGSQWMDGCDFQCVCEDADAGRYRCDQRCPKHTDTPTGCQLVTDPDDTCCQAVECAPSLVPTASPLPYPVPYPIPVKIPGKKTGQLVGTNNTGCMYNGKEYKQGDSWDDGCSFKCRCLDDNTGVYECDERCVQYTNLPQTCQLVPDPADNCCEVPKCADVNPSPAPTPSPKPGDPTLAPGQGGPTPSTQAPGIAPLKTDFCVYNGRSYTQGQVWYDGCAQMCVCEDAQSNYYRCKQRCAEYNNVPLTCVMVPDPNDPSCCQRPDCGSDPSVNVTGYTGKVSGFGTPPTTVAPSPGMVPSTVAPPFPVFPTPPRVQDACLYKGVYYTQGQKWRDGCDYNCECIDGTTGKYECIELCPNYVNTASCPLVRDTSNPCCLVPSCTPNALTTLVPGPGQPTPPTLPTPYPVLFTTVVPQKAFCVYNGVPYKQYDEWADGCDYRCRCEDAVNNQVNCDQRCSTYANLPAQCSLVTDPSDQCCQVPVCVPTPGQSPNTPVSGVLGSFTGKYLPGGSQNPVPQDVCVYHGRTYKQGEQWRDGCMYNCSCLDATQGLYGCTERCLRYPQVPQGCQLIPDPQDACCEVIDCPTPAPATVLPPVTLTPGPGAPTPTPGPGGPTPTPGPGGLTLTPGPGDPTPTPGPGGPTPSPGPGQMTAVPPTADACLYNGQYYRQGQIWYSGCSSVCSCDNATTNYYTCRERCRRYDSVPKECVMIPDPTDPSCCSVPNCPLVQPGAVPTPGPIPATQKPGSIVGIGKVPTPAPMITPAYYTGPTMVPPTSAPGCVYDGTVYKQGDQWSDACLWDCECEDATQGLYRCTEKCPSYYSYPPECVMMTDPANPCCSIPYCDFMNPSPFPNGIPTLVPGQKPINVTGVVTNFEGNNELCVYKGVFYQQGQEWMDGCDYKCVCDDGKTGYYTCTDRCPTYFDVSPQCSIITDPSDQCCTIPSCPVAPTLAPGPTPTPGTGSTLTPPTTQAPQYVLQPRPPAVFTGQGGTPIRQPNSITGYQTGFTAACVYKGQFYKQDQAFDDGCQYKCTCEDAQTGRFRCVERCAKYLSVPPVCTMETDPNDICCEVPKCPSAQTPAPPAPNTTAVSPATVSPKSSANPPTGSTVTTMKPPTGSTATTMKPPTGSTVTTMKPPTGSTVTTMKPPTGSTATTMKPPTGSTVTTMKPPTGSTATTMKPPTGSTMSTQSPPTASTTSQKPPTTPPDMCIYNGKAHVQGDIWADDTNCAYRCQCDDAANNIYSCNSNCPIFAELPSYCTLVDDPASQCCKKPDCQVNGQNVTTLVPIGTVDVISGSSGRGQTTPGICVYNGQQYKAGDSWYDGCDLSCTCGEDGGVYTCVSRCPIYPPAPAESNCKYISIPGQCCSTLQCNITGVGTYTPVPQIGAVPQQVVVGSTSAPITGQNTPSPQIWVIPGMYGNITGNGAVPGGGNNSSTGGVSGYRDKCIANNQLYSQGETWNLDCDMQCECVDAFTGYYTCNPTCLKYDSALLPKSCSLVKKDCCQVPQCQGPDGSIIDPVADPNPALPIAGYVGGGFSGSRPSYLDGRNTSTTGQRDGCVYKGVLYKNGDTWDDGCDYSCTCIDNVIGQYLCYEMCPTYQHVPALCRLVDQPEECCKTLQCDPVPTIAVTTPSGSGMGSTQSPSATTASPQTGSEPYDPNCHDSLANCKSYGRSACQAPYVGWANAHCPLSCGFCTPSYTTTPIPCVDLKNCPLYGANVCTKFRGWAETNCRKFCNLCGPNATPPDSPAPPSTLPTSTPAPGECADRLNCKAYGAYVCSEPQYTTWAANNCPKFCGQCGDETTVATTPAAAGVCVYNNVSYGQDETWKDGCAYDCRCVNASSGRYVCNTLCANYPNLPPECRLVTKPGQCCAEPVCNGIAPLKGCYYKGTAYSEGAAWTDGCDFDCICLNSTTGDFRCKAICPHWDLPAECTLGEPDPGLCCPTPKCPFTWVPPAGYVPR